MSNLIIADGAVPTVGGKALGSTTAITPSSSANANSAKLLTHDDKVLIAQNGKGLEAPAVPVVDPWEKFDEFLSVHYEESIGGFKYLKRSYMCGIPQCFTSGSKQMLYPFLEFFSVKSFDPGYSYVESGAFRIATKLKYVHLPSMDLIMSNVFNNNRILKALVLDGSTVVPLQNTNAFTSSGVSAGTGYVWVKDILVSSYKEASNWSTYADQIKGYSESQVYDTATEYGIGDVCQYSGKFYGYCKEDLQPATGHAPSGTAEDNEYWEYIDDIEVGA